MILDHDITSSEELKKLIENKDYYQKMIEKFNNPDNNFEFYFAILIPA